MSAVRSALAGTCGFLLLTGCSGGAPKATMVSRSAPLVTTSKSASPPVSVEVGKAYVEVLASGNGLGAVREALRLAAPNSVAYQYLDHMANMLEASLDAGYPPNPKEAVVPDGGDAFKTCSDPANDSTCATFGGFKVNGNGKLVDLTVNRQPVGPRLTVGNGESVKAGGAKFTLLTAYQSVASNQWLITIKVQTGPESITINPKTWSYRGPDGKPLTSVGSTPATHVVSKASLIVVVVFDSAKAGGTLTLEGCLARLTSAVPGEEDKLCPDASFSAVMKVG
jgi:hypothetical protein